MLRIHVVETHEKQNVNTLQPNNYELIQEFKLASEPFPPLLISVIDGQSEGFLEVPQT